MIYNYQKTSQHWREKKMKRFLMCIGLTALTLQGFSQKKQPFVFADIASVTVDATHTEWDTLYAATPEGLWFYNIAQDPNNVYVAVRIDDPILQSLATRNGILVSFLSTKKKKRDSKLIFPYPDREVKRAIQHEDFDPAKDYRTELISRSRGYFVDGFPSVLDGLLSFQNQYGIIVKAHAAKDNVLYEAVIPKSLLETRNGTIAIKLAVNDGLTALLSSTNTRNRPSAYSPYARGPYMQRSPAKQRSKTSLEVVLEGTLK